jgi:hypothetical protein
MKMVPFPLPSSFSIRSPANSFIHPHSTAILRGGQPVSSSANRPHSPHHSHHI